MSSREEQVAMKWAASSRGPPHSLQLGSPGVVLFLLYLNRLASDSRPWQPASSLILKLDRLVAVGLPTVVNHCAAGLLGLMSHMLSH